MNRVQILFRKSILQRPQTVTGPEYTWLLGLDKDKELSEIENNELNKLQKKKDGIQKSRESCL